ncbi:MAG: radical SAM protein [Chloroflexi bacterium]|nr:radical SAM protein [Chloroflexota bacterium]
MDTRQKLALLGDAAQGDVLGDGEQAAHRGRSSELVHCVGSALLPNGRRVKLLKVLLSNVCQNDCAYCAVRAGRDVPRAAFTPDEMARGFHQMQSAGLVEGLFLSSGVGMNPVREMDRLIAAAEITRRRYGFRGYVHLKILPGALPDQVERAAQLADRISANLEAPNPQRLARLSSAKQFRGQLLASLQTASRLIRAGLRRPSPPSITTQYVVGASDESDREILATSSYLYSKLGLARAYYSGFRPIVNTPLEDHPGTPLAREHRLYQADFLLRQYGFGFDELVFADEGNLPSDRDPKQAWAEAHPEHFPVEVNLAPRAALLRVPGIGPKAAQRILAGRGQGKIRDLAHLRALGIDPRRAGPWVLLDGRRPPLQLCLWPDGPAGGGEPAPAGLFGPAFRLLPALVWRRQGAAPRP